MLCITFLRCTHVCVFILMWMCNFAYQLLYIDVPYLMCETVWRVVGWVNICQRGSCVHRANRLINSRGSA